VNVENKEQSKQWMHTHSPPNKPKKFKQTLSAKELMITGFLGWEMSGDGGIHATRNRNNVKSVLRNTKKNYA
jgi:hypothetical protein